MYRHLEHRLARRVRECLQRRYPNATLPRVVVEQPPKVELGDFAAAVPDLERAVKSDPDYDFHRAKGLLAWAYAQTGQAEKADALFREATRISTISETYYHYALFLESQGRAAEAREWARKILDKKPTMPVYLRRRERPWFRKASSLLARLPAA